MHKTLFILFLLYQALTAYSQAGIDFKADHTSDCKSIIVQYSVTGNTKHITNYFWDLGNGRTSTMANPQISYTQAKKYTVKLIYTYNGIKTSIEKKDYIEVFETPIVAITASDTMGCKPLLVNFKSTTLSNSLITNYTWNYSDGTSDVAQNPSHLFNYASNYLIQVKIQDNNGCTNIISYNKKIHVLPIPTINYETDIDSTCNNKQAFNFINKSTGIEPLNYNWDFNNTKLSTLKNPNNIVLGTYNPKINLRVTDANNCSNTLTFNNKPVITELSASFKPSKKITCIFNQISFNNTSVGAHSYTWDFGDNNNSTMKSPTHTYSKAGTYVVTLTVVNTSNCISEYIDTIIIDESIAAFKSSTNYICQLPQAVQFNNLSTNSIAWIWVFGDGEQSNEKIPIHNYKTTTEIEKNKSLKYSTMLITTSVHGCKDTLIVKDNISINLPTAYFTPNDFKDSGMEYLVKGCIPLKLTFINESVYNSDNDSIIKWYWNMGDSKSYTTKHVHHTYMTDTTFKITMTLETNLGCKATFTSGAQAGTKQQANFKLDGPAVICASSYAHLIDLSIDTGKVDQWIWSFNNGQTYSDMHHPYVDLSKDTGLVDVQLNVGYNGCISDPIIKQKIIRVIPPIARYKYSFNCEDPYTFTFNPTLIGVDKLKWEFGDGTIDTLNKTAIHTYKNTGYYNATLTGYNLNTGCNFISRYYLTVKDIKAVINSDKNKLCKGDTITLNSTKSIDFYYYKYWKILNTENYIPTFNDSIKYKFTKEGIYTIQLVVRASNGCVDTASKQIHIYQPKADFSMISPIGCTPIHVIFKDSSKSDTTITEYTWYTGVETIKNKSITNYTFTENGTYSPSLVIKDILGCKDSIIKKNTIISSLPTADISVKDSTACINNSIEIKNLSLGNKISYKWFNNKTIIDSSKNLVTILKDTGTNNLMLIVTDNIGCKDTMSKIFNVQKPAQTLFTSDINYNSCYPSQINFNNQSKSNYPTQYTWNFGDDEPESFEENPVKYYHKPGTFSIRLISTTNYGCIDTLTYTDMITIGGPKAEIEKNKDTLCIHDSLALKIINKQNTYKHLWDMGDGNIYSTEITKHVYNQSGTKYPTLLLFVDSLHTCDKFISDTIKIYDIIPSENISDTMGCIPFNIDLSNLTNSAETWVWTTIDSTTKQNNFNFNKAGYYSLKLNASNFIGCTDSTIIKVYAKSRPQVNIEGKSILCKGETSTLKVANGQTFKWNSSENKISNNTNELQINPSFTCTYTVTLTNDEDCSESASIIIHVQQEPAIDLIEDTSIIVGYSFILAPTVEFANLYKWQPAIGLESDSLKSTSAKPLQTITYTLYASDSNHCFTTQKSIAITVNELFTLGLPDYFTPDNDGNNDIIYARGNGLKELILFRIYNEWGEEVFSTSDITKGWDGFYKGKLQNKGSYVFIIKAQTLKETIIEQKGNFTLM